MERYRVVRALLTRAVPGYMIPPEDADEIAGTPATTTSPSLAERVRILAGGRNSVSLKGRASGGGGVNASGLRDEAAETRTGSDSSRRVDPEIRFREKAIRDLGSSRRLTERIEAAKVVAQELELYSVDTVMEIWKTVEDFTREGVAVEARNTGFILLQRSASHSGLGSAERLTFFRMIIVPIEPTHVILQIRALVSLTSNGRNLDPFEQPLIQYFNETLESQFNYVTHSRSELRSLPSRRSRDVLPEEEGLDALLGLIKNVIVGNRDAFKGNELSTLVSRVLFVATKTTAKRDMKGSMAIIAALVELSRLPIEHLRCCVEVLCAVLCTIDELADLTWQSLFVLLRHQVLGNKVLDILLNILSTSSQDRLSSTTRGALQTLKHLFLKKGVNGLPSISLTQLMNGLWELHLIWSRFGKDCLSSIVLLLEDEGRVESMLPSDWDTLIRILVTAAGNDVYVRNITLPIKLQATLFSKPPQGYLSSINRSDNGSNLKQDIIVELKHISHLLVSLWSCLNVRKKISVGVFFLEFRQYLPTAALELLLQQIVDERLAFPATDHWENVTEALIDWFLLDQTQAVAIRCSILDVLTVTIDHISSDEDKRNFRRIFLDTMAGLDDERSLQIMNRFASFASLYSEQAEVEDFQSVIKMLRSTIFLEEVTSNSTSAFPAEPVVNTVVPSLVRLFLRCLSVSARKAVMLYNLLVELVTDPKVPANSRLTAMKLLARLRCDSDHAIMVIPVPDGLDLAATLCRTEDSAFPMSFFRSQGDRTSVSEEQQAFRSSRTSAVNSYSTNMSRPNTRSTSGQDRNVKPAPPLWMYPGGKGLPEDPPIEPSKVLYAWTPGSDPTLTLKLNTWLLATIEILQHADDWEVYSYILVHLPSQLSNPLLFSDTVPHIQMLRNIVIAQLQSETFHVPPSSTAVKKGDVALCLFHVLVMLLSYCEHFARSEQDDIVRTFLTGIGSWDRVVKICIHALAICCHEIPLSVSRSLNGILQKMSQIITQSNLTMDILEFLGGLAGLPAVYANLTEGEIRTVFAICIRYLEHSREQRLKLLTGSNVGTNYTANRHSGLSNEFGSASESSQSIDVYKDLPQYVFALAYHVMTFWFLSLRLTDRSKHVGWITRSLAWKDKDGEEIMEEQSRVTLDMMYRTAYSDLGETVPNTEFKVSDGKVLRKSWLVGLSIVTVETAVGTGLTQLTKRQASGTTYAMYQQHTAPLHPHHVPAPSDIMSSTHGPESRINAFPNHVFLQLQSTIAPTPTPMEPICLPDDEFTKRAISAFDRNDTVDGHKIGVIYVGNNQSLERDILANATGSDAFEKLLNRLGTKVRLKGATFNTQGLDREFDTDGTHTYAWRDRVTEIIYHVPTMMPTNLDHDAQCVNKKRHIGNDFVNIFFNESGLPFKFDSIPSQFNYVNIVVTPDALLVPYTDSYPKKDKTIESESNCQDASTLHEKQRYFKVQTFSHHSFPQISPTASYKVVSAKALPALVRQLALNASVFSHVWANREGGEHVSSWRNRYREIVRLRKKFANTGTSTSAKFPGARGDKTYEDGDRWNGVVAMGGLAEEEGVLSGLDFSRWAGPNPPLF